MSTSEQPGLSRRRSSPLETVLEEEAPHLAQGSSTSTARQTRTRSDPFGIKPERSGREDVAAPLEVDTSWFDGPLLFGLLPAVGSIFTGNDILRDFLHLALLLFYLHHLIKAPWGLYLSARAKRANASYLDLANDPARKLARAELRLAELTFLGLTIMSPFLGATLLRYIASYLSIDTVSTFSTSLFVLSTGIRPWRHMVDLLLERNHALHDIVHLPSDDSLLVRVEAMEAQLNNLQSLLEARTDEQDVLEAAQSSLDLARRELKRVEKAAEANRAANEARFRVLEGAVDTIGLQSIHHPAQRQQRGPTPNSPYVVLPDHLHPGRTVTLTVPKSLAELLLKPLTWLLTPPPSEPSYGRNSTRTTAEIVEVEDADDPQSEYVEHRKPGKHVTFAVVERKEKVTELGIMDRASALFVYLAFFPARLLQRIASLFLEPLRS